jgi:TrmH family RNA methyltransferase
MIISSRQNTIIKQFRAPEKSSLVIEGEKLISEALRAGFKLQYLLFTDAAKHKLGLPGTVISADLSAYISDTKSPQGVFAMFARPQSSFDFAKARRVMILDGVRDPGNAGAILRSCEAFGFGGVILGSDSADVFGNKVIRASAGSVFRLPSIRADLHEQIPLLREGGFKVCAAALDESAVSLKDADFADKSAVVIGNEGSGVSKTVLALCDEKLYIPISGAESLNAGVAAGIICYEMGGKQNGSRSVTNAATR